MFLEKDCYYHIYNRGCNKCEIFASRKDYEKIIDLISKSNYLSFIEMYAFSFMPNHFHIFGKQVSDKPLTSWTRYVFSNYVKYFNNRHQRKGPLFEGRIKIKQIQDMGYLSNIVDYIHSNPKGDRFLSDFSSLGFLNAGTIVNKNFYLDNYDSIENYLEYFYNYQSEQNDLIIENYLFSNSTKTLTSDNSQMKSFALQSDVIGRGTDL